MFSPLVVVIAVVVGLLLGLLGGGGSIVTVPLLVYGVGLEPKAAIATSLLIVALASAAALFNHTRAGNVLWRIGLLFGAAGMTGAYVGGSLAVFIPGPVLLIVFACVMFGAGGSMLRRRRSPQIDMHDPVHGHGGLPLQRVLADGFGVGAVTGLVGAGGGFLIVPALVLLGGLPMHAAVGTSLLVITMNSCAGLAGYLGHVAIDVPVAALVGGLAVAGTVAGSWLSGIVSGPSLRVTFGCFVLLTALVLLYRETVSVLCDRFSMSHGLATTLMLGLAALAIMITIGWWLRREMTPPKGVP